MIHLGNPKTDGQHREDELDTIFPAGSSVDIQGARGCICLTSVEQVPRHVDLQWSWSVLQ
jgi:hypothetical protein